MTQPKMSLTPQLESVNDRWLGTANQTLLITLLVTAQTVGFITVLQLLFPERSWLYFIPIVFFAALEGQWTTNWLAHPDQFVLNRTIYRASEMIALGVMVRLFTWINGDGLPTLADLRFYLLEPVQFLAGDFLIPALFVTLFAWQRGIAIDTLFNKLALDKSETNYYTQTSARERLGNDRPIRTNRVELVKDYFRSWLWGGMVLIVCTAVSTFELSELAHESNPLAITRLGIRPEMLVALILYFLIGFWLSSQARLAVMNARWLTSGTQQYTPIGPPWRRYSSKTLLIIAGIATFLPIGSTLGISRILQGILQVIVFLFNFLYALLFFLLTRFSSSDVPEETPDAPFDLNELMSPTQAYPPATSANNETVALVFGSFFWIVIIVIAMAAMIFVLRERGYAINGRQLIAQWQRLIHWLKSLWQNLSVQTETIRSIIRTRLTNQAKSESSQPALWRFVRVNSLSPRDQIRYFYLSIVRRASERGVQRQEHETPLEYAQDLSENWPELEGEVEALTNAFLKARYSSKTVATDEANHTKRYWRQLRSYLRRLRSLNKEK